MSESIFAGFSPDEIGRIKEAGTPVTLPEGWAPIWENSASDKAYILLSGEVSIRRHGEEIARLGAGDIVGEASFVRQSLRTASVVALTPLAALHYTHDAVERLCEEVPGFRERLEAVVAERMAAPQG